MSTVDPHRGYHPGPEPHVLPRRPSFFLIFGGPLAWLLQLNADFALASNPCFFDNERSLVPHLAYDWTWRAMIAIAAAAIAVALAATLIAGRDYRLTRAQSSGNRDVLEFGAARTRFLALWGICLGAGSALLILLTAFAFFVLPRCAG